MNKLVDIWNEDSTVIMSNKAFDLNAYKEDVLNLLHRNKMCGELLAKHREKYEAEIIFNMQSDLLNKAKLAKVENEIEMLAEKLSNLVAI